MSEALLVQRHERSRRTAVIADEGDSVWLYLTEPGSRAISADCWLFNRIAAPTSAVLKEQFSMYRSRGLPPPAPLDVIVPGSVRSGSLDGTELQVHWSRDGHGVAAWGDGRLIAFISPEGRGGFSRFLLVKGPWGAPLDLELYQRAFPSHRGSE